jgi:hypothetical protein
MGTRFCETLSAQSIGIGRAEQCFDPRAQTMLVARAIAMIPLLQPYRLKSSTKILAPLQILGECQCAEVPLDSKALSLEFAPSRAQ